MISKIDSWEVNIYELFIVSIRLFELYILELERELDWELVRELERELALLRLVMDFIFLLPREFKDLEKFIFTVLVLIGQRSVKNNFSWEVS